MHKFNTFHLKWVSICVLLLLLRLDTHCLFYFNSCVFFSVSLFCRRRLVLLLLCALHLFCFGCCCFLVIHLALVCLPFVYSAKCITSSKERRQCDWRDRERDNVLYPRLDEQFILFLKRMTVAFDVCMCVYEIQCKCKYLSFSKCLFLYSFLFLFTFRFSLFTFISSVQFRDEYPKINALNWLIHCGGVKMTTIRNSEIENSIIRK